jgi:hypothetical protein
MKAIDESNPFFVHPFQRKDFYYISDLMNNDYVINNRSRIILHAPMGSGKSLWISQLQKDYPDERFAFLYIYKNDLLEQFNRLREHYLYVSANALRSGSEVSLEGTQADVLHMYTTILFDLFLGILEEYKFYQRDENSDLDSKSIVESIISDRIIVSDEADFLSNILHAVANSQNFNNDLDINLDVLFGAAKKFYAEIDAKAKSVILLTATLQSKWLSILPDSFKVFEPNYPVVSVNLRSVTIIPMTEWVINENTLTANIVYKTIMAKKYDRVLLYAPSINLTVLKNLSNIKGKKIAVVANQDKITGKAYDYINSNKRITLIPFQSETDEDLDSKLTDNLVRNHDYVFITNSNCRGISLRWPYGQVLVITIAPIGSETIQASGRFRNTDNVRIDLVMIDRLKVRNEIASEFKYNKKLMMRKYRNFSSITDELCYDISFSLKNSMIPCSTEIVRDYISEDYVFKQVEVLKEIKNSKKSEETIRKSNAIKDCVQRYFHKSGRFIARKILEDHGVKVSQPTVENYRKAILAETTS